MTSDEIRTVKYKGVTCRADMCVYRDEGAGSYLYLLSVYGALQQVKAIASAVVTGSVVSAGGISLTRGPNAMRFKITSHGNGKSHGMVWIDEIREHVIWSGSDEMKALDAALSRRRIPYDREWLSDIQRLLIDNSCLTRLEGWGGLQGYHAFWDDDTICDLIAGSCFDFRTGKEVK